MAGALILAVARLEMIPVFGCVKHDCATIQSKAFEGVDQSAKGFVEALDLSIVSGDMLRRGAAKRGQVWRDPFPSVALTIAVTTVLARTGVRARGAQDSRPYGSDDAAPDRKCIDKTDSTSGRQCNEIAASVRASTR